MEFRRITLAEINFRSYQRILKENLMVKLKYLSLSRRSKTRTTLNMAVSSTVSFIKLDRQKNKRNKQ